MTGAVKLGVGLIKFIPWGQGGVPAPATFLDGCSTAVGSDRS